MTDADRQAGRVPLPPERAAELVALIEEGTISGKIAKELLEAMIETGKGAGDLVSERGLAQVSDEGAIRVVLSGLLAANPQQVATYRGGKSATFGWFVGQAMKATQGKANPGLVNKLLRELLDAEGVSP
jgi:aspartyl-tRNA(Asn)/glutamyl-tRNA(Gln) amidotransferase subunit B